MLQSLGESSSFIKAKNEVMLSAEQNILIEKYLSGKLSKKEQSDFDLALKDETFREQLIFQAQLIDSFRKEEKEVLLEAIKSYKPSDSKPVSKKKTQFLGPLRIAAGLALLLAAYFVLQIFTATDNSQIYTEHFRKYPPTVSERGQGEKMEVIYKDAMQAYVNDDYQKALTNFRKLGSEDEKISLYLVMSLLELDKISEAQEILVRLNRSQDERIRQNAEWYLALSYLKTNNIQRSIDLLNPISQDADHLFTRDAKELLVKLMN